MIPTGTPSGADSEPCAAQRTSSIHARTFLLFAMLGWPFFITILRLFGAATPGTVIFISVTVFVPFKNY